ncbi:hypothetical protein [Nonomuraea candida]|uniref:hypothetical protein n=1 Tax=Nonomuraea candida TaxID=359159 RepID=UPI000AA3D697|nr:hypothetical protein [Nonomuraea candida]
MFRLLAILAATAPSLLYPLFTREIGWPYLVAGALALLSRARPLRRDRQAGPG